MKCPNCSMNIKDDASFCIHCGLRFDGINAEIKKPSLDPNNISNQGNFVVKQNREELDTFDRYLKIYLGKKYDSIISHDFSFGTFFFGIFWLLANGLFGAALKLFLINVGVGFVAGILNFVLAAMGIGFPLFTVIALFVDIYIAYIFGKEFSYMFLNKASVDIDSIMKTTSDENVIIKYCERKNRARILCSTVAISLFIAIPALIVYTTFNMVQESINSSRKNIFLSTANQYVNEAKTMWAVDNIKCNGVQAFEVNPGKYNIKIKTGCDDEKACINAKNLVDVGGKSPWNNANVQGFILIDVDSSHRQKYYIQLIDANNRGIKYDGIESWQLRRNNVQLNSGISFSNAQTTNLPTSTECIVEKS